MFGDDCVKCACHDQRVIINCTSAANAGDDELSLINRISDTLAQGYTILESLVKCLDHRGIALGFVSTVCGFYNTCSSVRKRAEC